MKMNKKSKIIICLLVIATILFCIIQFGFIPANREKEAQYAQNQTDALTHDIASIEDYKSPYDAFPYWRKPSEKHHDGKQVSSLRATTRIEGR